MFNFKRKNNFDVLLENLPEIEKAAILSKYIQLELAHAWLREHDLRVDIENILKLSKLSFNNNINML